VRGYNRYAPPDRDYPLGRFTRKQDERDNAIGYQKAAMVFHLLRQEVGEQAFWHTLKKLVARYRGRRADWHDVERIFADTAVKDLRWFFAQWVEGSGAPDLTLANVSSRPIPGRVSENFQLKGRIVQTGTVFRSPVPLLVRLADEREHTIVTQVTGGDNSFAVDLPSQPLTIELDPDAMILRRMPRQALPPVLNHYVTDQRRSLVVAFPESADARHPFQDVMKRIETQESQKPLPQRTAIIRWTQDTLLPQEGSVLVLGAPAFRTALESVLSTHCGTHVQFRETGVTVGGKTYEGPDIAVLASCHRQDRPGSVVTWLYALTPQAATAVGRLLFFYGWNSFVVFQEGRTIARGEWEPTQVRMEVALDEAVPLR